MMTDRQKRLQDEAPTPLSGFFTLLATVAAIGIAVLISPAGNYAASEANAAEVAGLEQAAGTGDHERAPLAGDGNLIPSTF